MQAIFDSGLKDYDAGNYPAAYATWHSIEDVDLAALRNIAVMLRKGQGVEKDPKAAAAKMERAAEAGLVTAEADLGDMLLSGETGKRDVAAALPWLGRAVAAGHPLAAFQLAQLYETGDGVPKDLEIARKLYQQAANAGLEDAAKALKALPPPAPALRGPADHASGH
jgi:TPR repeat protein